MIRHEILSSILRFYAVEHPAPFEPYVAVCTAVWESPRVVWLHGMSGEMGRPQLRELVRMMQGMGVQLVKARRAPGHRLPFGVDVGDHVEIDVQQVARLIGEDGS
ncbi:MAG TPA: hypothetical protein P5305_04095 [Rubrivivax sp.]|nr:hypothetical protein [Rubrivivax sp.]HRY87044.1 hypothetical protein [Rubrivivax sp.]